jgi:hypothetical protein
MACSILNELIERYQINTKKAPDFCRGFLFFAPFLPHLGLEFTFEELLSLDI